MRTNRTGQFLVSLVASSSIGLGAGGCGVDTELDDDPGSSPAAEIAAASSALTPTDPHFSKQWSLYNQGQTVPIEEIGGGTTDVVAVSPVDINARAAWDISQGSTSVIVGIIDPGDTDLTHPDLITNIYPCGHSSGCDFVDGDGMNMPQAHGTHIAGIIAARLSNSQGVVGVAPKVKILPMRASADDDSMIDAIDYARSVGVKIISVSQGGADFYNESVKAAIASSGILFVCSAGNDSTAAYNYPSAYALPNVISVANVDPTGEVAPMSNYGEAHVHIGAPGKGIYSTLPGNQYGYMDGTSMAAPHVAGVAALLRSKYSSLTVTQIRDRILRTGMKLTSLSGVVQTGAMLDAYAALKDVGPVAPAASSVPGTVTLQWPAVSGATRYDVEVDGSTVNVGNALSYVHSGLVTGSTHVYRVRATVSGSSTPWSYRVLKKVVQDPTREAYVLESSHPYDSEDGFTGHVTKRNAKLLRAHFSKVELAPGVVLQYMVNDGDDTYLTGSYASGFWTHWKPGELFFEVSSDESATTYGFKIDAIEYLTGIPEQPYPPYYFDVVPGKIAVGVGCSPGSVDTRVFRATSPGGTYTQVATLPQSEWKYEDTSVTAGVTYHYKISCSNDLGVSPQSDELSVVAQ
ncbi:S8 family serine peptidase [Sorangium sp. So ce321]|uniref:S8 family serine peptidase n=1 Tax=Sorangium sp. So ce321 TaxID=3133300 RepID=UPI003F5F4B0D